jgi:hypothetical protein
MEALMMKTLKRRSVCIRLYLATTQETTIFIHVGILRCNAIGTCRLVSIQLNNQEDQHWLESSSELNI